MSDDEIDRIRDALARYADEYAVRRRLHAIPPHAVYEVVVDGTRAVCKLECHPEGEPAIEGRVLQHVDRETSIPVPRVVGVGDDHFVAEWHDGAPASGEDQEGSGGELTAERARAMGAGLATLHDETSFESTGHFVADADGPILDRRESWAETVRERLERCRTFLEPHGYDDAAAAVVEFLREHPEALGTVDEPVLLHGNYLPAHVGVEGGEITCVLDFEHALAGAPALDYWATCLPTFENPERTADDDAYAAFRRGYESVRPLPEGVDRRRRAYWTVLGVTYLRSLYLQRDWESRAAGDRHAEALASSVRNGLAVLREEHG